MKSLRNDGVVVQVLLDLLLTSCTLVVTYWVAVRFGFLTKGTPPISGYLEALTIILVAFLWSAHAFNLYRPRPNGSHAEMVLDVVKVHIQVALITFAACFYFREFSYSRIIITAFFFLNTFVIVVHHVIRQKVERDRFARGIGTRSCLIIGRGELARSFAKRVAKHPWTGLTIRGYLDAEEGVEPVIPDDEILGSVHDLEALIEEHEVQEIIVALPFRAMGVLGDLDQRLSRTTVGLRSVLDLEAYNTLSREIGYFEGLQVINLRGVRTYGVNAFIKRSLDFALSGILLLTLSPLLLAIALYILMKDGRPIIFEQERVGLDGKVFRMLKFRTMRRDAEQQSGAVWADATDPRCIPMGNLLRRTSMDELPQLLNVLLGQMSLVGPRPERPVFIDEFRKTVPRYMLRHHMKSGLTGWAQINGWRGKTSLTKRLQYDLDYLRNWSVWLDIKILLLTLVRAWRHITPPVDREQKSSA